MKEFIVKLGSPELNIKINRFCTTDIQRVHMLRYTEISQRVGLGHIISLKLI